LVTILIVIILSLTWEGVDPQLADREFIENFGVRLRLYAANTRTYGAARTIWGSTLPRVFKWALPFFKSHN
jgi:hypothetical protein